MFTLLNQKRPVKTYSKPQTHNKKFTDSMPINFPVELEIEYPIVPTPAIFPGDILQSELKPIKTSHLPHLRKPFLHQKSFTDREAEQPSFRVASPTTTTASISAITVLDNSVEMNSTTHKKDCTIPSSTESGAYLNHKFFSAFHFKISRTLFKGLKHIFMLLMKNEFVLYTLSLILLPYLAYTYFSFSNLFLLIEIFLITCSISKIAKYWVSTTLPQKWIHYDLRRMLQNYSILDIIFAFGYLRYFAFYISRLYLLAFVDLTPHEREMVLQDWDPRMAKIVKTRLVEFIPKFLRQFIETDISTHLSIDSSVQQEEEVEEINNLDLGIPVHEFFVRDLECVESQPSEIEVDEINDENAPNSSSMEQWKDTTLPPNKSLKKIDSQKSKIPFEIAPRNRSKFLAIITRIMLRRFLFHPKIEKLFYTVKLRLHHIFTTLAIFTLIFYNPIARRILKKLPIGFFTCTLLSLYFYVLTHGWPKMISKFITYFKSSTPRLYDDLISPSSSPLSAQSHTHSCDHNRVKSMTIEDACSDLLREFTEHHIQLPKIMNHK